jgi:drug/metabolite transporter (DMT)-like permease
MSPRLRSLLQVHGAVLLFGLAGLFGKFLAFAPVVIVCGRAALAALALVLAAALGRLPLRPPPPRRLLAFAGLGLLLAVHWTTFFQSVQVSSVAVALITFATFPVFVAFLEPFLFRERLRAADVVLAGLALAGTAILLPGYELANRTTQGVLWGVASGLTFALLSLLNRAYVRQHSSITIALYQNAFAAVVALPFAILSRPSFSVRDVLLFLVLGVLCTGVAHSLFIAGLHGVKARTASMIACLEPVYGATLAVLFLGEVPSARTVVGGSIVLAVAFHATLHAGRGEAARKEARA